MTFMHYDLEKMVEKTHELRQVRNLIKFESLIYRIKGVSAKVGRDGYGMEVGLKCLFLQFYYDLSDRELERQLRDSMSYRWFCGFELMEKTPDHSFFGRVRSTIGTSDLAKIFNSIVKKAERHKLIRNIFSFVDATAIKSKETTWQQRDKAIKAGETVLNNDNVGQFSADPQARFGCKGKDKFWYGYKAHAQADMSSMLITKIAVTPANIPDQDGFRHICPRSGQMVFGDKSYCLKVAQLAMQKWGAVSAAIHKRNMKNKNKDLDRWRSAVRAPFEGLFSKCEKRARYRGVAKVQFQAFMDAIVWNTKRLIKINSPPLFSAAA